MWFLYLDESGDLGFDFVNKRPSNFFTITILASSSHDAIIKIRKAVKMTLRRKINRGGRAANLRPEIKASQVNLVTKRYFYEQVADERFGIYAVTLNKRQVYEELTQKKDHVYNYIARRVLDEIPFERAASRVQLVIDKSKGRKEIVDFDQYVIRQLEGRIKPKVILNIDHRRSHEELALQAVDLFSWGIFRKYEHGDTAWLDVYQEKIQMDQQYL